MQPRIETITEKKLIGNHLQMSLTNNKTVELWKGFMPRKKEIQNNVSAELFCLQIYDKLLDINHFDLNTVFDKWAAVEVSDFDQIPDGMEPYTLCGGLYAVFLHKGAANSFYHTWHYIFNIWLPSSAYELDQREHFEILGDKYINNDPNSEEDVWIPIKKKGTDQ